MALLEINRDPSPRQVRQFAFFALPVFCLLLAAIAVYRFDSWPLGWALAAVGVASVVLGMVRPRWMRLAFIGWMWAAFPIGWLVSHALLAVIFYLVMTPIGWMLRIVGHDPLARSFDPRAETYWVPRSQQSDPSRYFRQF